MTLEEEALEVFRNQCHKANLPFGPAMESAFNNAIVGLSVELQSLKIRHDAVAKVALRQTFPLAAKHIQASDK